jgi:hypothetical protein
MCRRVGLLPADLSFIFLISIINFVSSLAPFHSYFLFVDPDFPWYQGLFLLLEEQFIRYPYNSLWNMLTCAFRTQVKELREREKYTSLTSLSHIPKQYDKSTLSQFFSLLNYFSQPNTP